MSLLYSIGEWIFYYFNTSSNSSSSSSAKITEKEKYIIYCRERIPNYSNILSKEIEDIINRIIEEYYYDSNSSSSSSTSNDNNSNSKGIFNNISKKFHRDDIINFFKKRHDTLYTLLENNQNSGEIQLLTDDQYDEIYICSILKDYNSNKSKDISKCNSNEIIEKDKDEDLEDFILL